MAGRPPKPQALKKMQGTYRPDRDGGTTLAGSTTPPNWLSQAAKTEWRRVAKRLAEAGLLTWGDRALLAAYCQAYARWKQAEQELEGKPLTFETDKGYVGKNPLLTVANEARDAMIRAAKEFGMTPVARSRLNVGGSTEKEQTLADLLFEAVNGD